MFHINATVSQLEGNIDGVAMLSTESDSVTMKTGRDESSNRRAGPITARSMEHE